MLEVLVLLAMAPRRVEVRKVPEYSHHKLEDLCAGTEGEKKEVKLHNKPLVLTLNSTLRFMLKWVRRIFLDPTKLPCAIWN